MKSIQLTKGKFAIVDDEDFDWLNQWKWHITSVGYAARRQYFKGGKGKSIIVLMHCLINEPLKGFETDHIDRNRLNNQRSNLRSVTRLQNAHNVGRSKKNKSGHKGVCWDKNRKLWKVQSSLNSKHINIGRFNNIKDAILAKIRFEKLYWYA